MTGISSGEDMEERWHEKAASEFRQVGNGMDVDADGQEEDRSGSMCMRAVRQMEDRSK